MSFADYPNFHDAGVRLTILQLLQEDPGRTLSNQMLFTALDALLLTCTTDQLSTHLAWLKEQRLVELTEVRFDMVMATSTDRGADVAAGRTAVPGVARAKRKLPGG